MAFVMITRANQVPLKIVEECVTRRRSSVKGLFTLFSSILRPSFSHPSKQQQCNKSWKGSPFSSSSSSSFSFCADTPQHLATKDEAFSTPPMSPHPLNSYSAESKRVLYIF
jgi:hypothetical protein